VGVITWLCFGCPPHIQKRQVQARLVASQVGFLRQVSIMSLSARSCHICIILGCTAYHLRITLQHIMSRYCDVTALGFPPPCQRQGAMSPSCQHEMWSCGHVSISVPCWCHVSVTSPCDHVSITPPCRWPSHPLNVSRRPFTPMPTTLVRGCML
jgi:hypothetical protein